MFTIAAYNLQYVSHVSIQLDSPLKYTNKSEIYFSLFTCISSSVVIKKRPNRKVTSEALSFLVCSRVGEDCRDDCEHCHVSDQFGLYVA